MQNNIEPKIGYYFDLFSDRFEDWEKETDFNRSLNPEFLEVMLEFPPSNMCFSIKQQQALLSLLRGIPLNAHAPTIGVSLVTTNELVAKASIQEHLHAINVAKGLEASFLTIHGGEYPFYAPAYSNTSPANLFSKNIEIILAHANRLGIEICLENLKGKNIFPKTFEELDIVFDRHPTLAMALDIRHFYVEGFDPIEALQRYFPRIRSIHYRVDNGLNDSELTDFIHTLQELNYDGNFMIEDQALNNLQKDDKTMLKMGLEKVTEIFGYLKQDVA